MAADRPEDEATTRAVVARPRGGAAAPSRPSFAGPIIAGGALILGFFGLFAAWAVLAPLESAAIAPGIVAVESNRKTVQHLEGGIVERIMVHEGDRVTRGQVLIRLDETEPQTALDILRGRYLAASALEARLIAERDGKAQIAFPEWMTARRGEEQVEEAINGQNRIFIGHRAALEHQTAVLKQKSAQLHEEIVGLRGQIRAEKTQLALIDEELEDVRSLVDKGLARKARLLALERAQAEIGGSRSRNIAAIARAKQTITEAELRIAELRTTMLNEVATSLRETQTELFDLAERMRAAESVLGRSKIVAPIDGTVVRLQVHTTGGVIAPGAPLMDIVPRADRRIIDARVDPSDIDVVRAGLEARVRLTALPQRNFVPLPGKVVWVSADRLVEATTGESYFAARIALDDATPDLPGEVDIYPGMQAEVMIVTGTRTLFDYITQPLLLSFDRALRES